MISVLICAACYLVFAAGVLRIERRIVADDPSAMPGGGRKVLFWRAALWPLIAVAIVAAFVILGTGFVLRQGKS